MGSWAIIYENVVPIQTLPSSGVLFSECKNRMYYKCEYDDVDTLKNTLMIEPNSVLSAAIEHDVLVAHPLMHSLIVRHSQIFLHSFSNAQILSTCTSKIGILATLRKKHPGKIVTSITLRRLVLLFNVLRS